MKSVANTDNSRDENSGDVNYELDYRNDLASVYHGWWEVQGFAPRQAEMELNKEEERNRSMLRRAI